LDGLHILASLYRCRGEPRHLTDAAALRESCIAAIERAGLSILGDLFRQFPGADGAPDPLAGVTGCVVLAESHLAIHTWPEFGCVTLDAYVCNYSCDNTARARALVAELTRLFQPEDCVRQDVSRGRPQGSEHARPGAPYERPGL
jgi:S-adenosylmethionine decarboxylase proenzyme